MSFKEERILIRLKKGKTHKPIKQACSKAARHKKESAYLVDTSDEEDNEFVGNK